MLSSLFLSQMSVDRLLAVRYPLKTAQFCTVRKAKTTILITAVAIAGLNTNMFFSYRYFIDDKGMVLLLLLLLQRSAFFDHASYFQPVPNDDVGCSTEGLGSPQFF